MAKKYFAFVLFFVVAGIVLPAIALADGTYQTTNGAVCYDGFVPCGKQVYLNGKLDSNTGKCDGSGTKTQVYCQFCHFFVMANGIVYYVLARIVPFLAILMLIVGGIMYYFAGAKPSMLGQAKNLITGVVIGLFLIYGAYIIVGTFLSILGVTKASGLADWASKGIFSIKCDIQ